MKGLLKLGVLIIILLVPIGIWTQIKSKERGKKHFEVFYSAEINSQIETVRIAYKGSGIKLTDDREFVFYPLTDKNFNNGRIFNQTAEKGDKIIKRAYEDTLYLHTQDGVLKYAFQKFE